MLNKPRLSRRALLAGTAASALAAAMPAHAWAPFRRGGHPHPSGAPLAVTLAFADGNTLSFSQTSATDIGDYVSAVGGWTQKCFRQRASGNSDYRDAFTVYFRPDADGSRSEIGIEYGCELAYSTSLKPAFPLGSTPPNLFIPPTPTVTKTTGNTSGQSGTINANVSYVFADGESVPAPGTSTVCAVGDRIIVTSPPARGGATAYRVYANFTTNGSYPSGFLQAEVPIGTDWTEPTTGLVLSGATEKTLSTSTAYTATISGGVLSSPVTISVKNHWTAARWRWFSAPRPRVRTLADLVAMKAIFPMSSAYLFGGTLPPAVSWEGPMGHGGLDIGMPDAGDRSEVGFINEWEAAWLLTGNSTMETSWRAAAEATGTMQWWIRDAATGTWPDLTTYLYLSWSNLQAAKYTLPQGLYAVKGTCGNCFQMDQAHMPTVSFIAWLLTDDPYFLEGAQAEAIYSVMEGNNLAFSLGTPYLIRTLQPRSWAWGMRSLFRMAGFAPASVPSWLQPRSYFAALLPNNLSWANRYLASANPQCSVFGMIVETSDFPAFQQHYIEIVTSWIKYTGLFSAWDAVVDYTHQSQLAMSDPTDAAGWDHRAPSVYYWSIYTANRGAAAVNGVLNGDYSTAPTADTATSFAQWWADFQLSAAANPGTYPFYTDPSTWAPDTLQRMQTFYLLDIRAVLAGIALSGNAAAKTAHDWLDSHMRTDLPSGLWANFTYKWAFSPT